jgi:small subunit ribosomal protein S3
MGQKVNPHGLRVDVTKDWDSQWYEEPEFADNIVELENNNQKVGKIRN